MAELVYCQHIFKQGKNKGNICNKLCRRPELYGDRCYQHSQIRIAKNKSYGKCEHGLIKKK